MKMLPGPFTGGGLKPNRLGLLAGNTVQVEAYRAQFSGHAPISHLLVVQTAAALAMLAIGPDPVTIEHIYARKVPATAATVRAAHCAGAAIIHSSYSLCYWDAFFMLNF
jgi:hypothetical protein